MSFSLLFTSWALPSKPISCYVRKLSTSPSSLRGRVVRCSSLQEQPSVKKEEEECEKAVVIEVAAGSIDRKSKRRLRFALKQWRRIVFPSKKGRSVILLNFLAIIYASNISVLKEVEAITEPAFFNMVRFSVLVIPFLPYMLKARGDSRTRNAGLELGLWVSLGYLAQAVGLISSDAGRASFISAFTAVIVPLIGGIFGASVRPLTWFGAIMSLLGVALLECGGSPPCVGDLLNIFSATFFGVHMLRTEQISRSTKKEKFLALLSFQIFVVALSSVAWFMFNDMLHDVHHLSFDSFELPTMYDFATSFPWIPALYTGLFSTGLCLWAEMYAMGDVSATETAIIYGLEPVWGAAFAWFLLGERWGTTAWIGAAFVLCGSLTVQIFGSAPESSQKVKQDNSSGLKASQKQDYFSFSTVAIDSRKNIGDQLKRKDKLLYTRSNSNAPS